MAKKKPNWVVQHEFDTEPTYVVDKANDPDGDNAISFPADMPQEDRRAAAKYLADYLNKKLIAG